MENQYSKHKSNTHPALLTAQRGAPPRTGLNSAASPPQMASRRPITYAEYAPCPPPPHTHTATQPHEPPVSVFQARVDPPSAHSTNTINQINRAQHKYNQSNQNQANEINRNAV